MVSTHFSLRVEPSATLKVIISVSKKVSKSAVLRNRVRRRIRPIIREMGLKKAQYLLVVRPSAKDLKGLELKEELVDLLKNL